MSTYTPISSFTATTSVSSVTIAGIPQNYTDLVLVFDGLSTAVPDAIGFQIKVNGASGTLQSYTRLQGNGSTASSAQVANGDPAVGVIGNSERTNIIAQIMNYSNSTTFKTIISRYNSNDAGDGRTGAYVNLTRATTAITSLLVDLSAGSFASGSTFNLYGVANASITNTAKATGGSSITTDGTYWYHTFLSSGTFTPTENLSNVDYLVVAGGGAGGSQSAPGGGGGGGLRSTVTATGGGGSLESALSLALNTNYTVTVGAGGTGAFAQPGTSGSNSVFSTITSTGGGGGGGTGALNGQNGGSGGGGAANNPASTGGTRQTGQGFAGGTGFTDTTTTSRGGGGGGAGAVGTDGTVTGGSGSGVNGNGGNGVATSISGSSVTYAGGGGGGSNGFGGGTAGSGGGTAGKGDGTASTAASANTGGGSGAATGATPGNGGSGIVIIRYAV